MDTIQTRIRLALGLIRLKPYDKSTPDGRSKERLRRVFLTSASALIARAVSMAGPLITVPLALSYLGQERYGLWMTVSAIVGMFTFADLGLGNGLMTQISQAEGRGDQLESRRSVTSALIALSGMGLLLLCLYSVLFPFVPWPRVLNATSAELLQESGRVVTVCVLGLVVNLPLGVIQRTQCGLQEGFQSNLWQCIGSAINVAVILISVRAHAPLWLLVLCVTGVQPLVNLLNGCVFFGVQRPQLRPRLRDFHWNTARRLLGTGFWFFLVSILMAVGVYSDNVVVAQVVGLSKVPLYSIPSSLSMYLATVASMLYAPFWAANGEALARGDTAWVRRNTLRIIKLNALITGVAGVAFVVLGPVFLHLWIGKDFSPGRPLFAGMASWAFLTAVLGPLFMILNGANAVRAQALMFGVFSLVAISLKVILAHRIGITGVVWASVVPYAVLVVPTVVLLARRVLSRAERTWAGTAPVSELQLEAAKGLAGDRNQEV